MMVIVVIVMIMIIIIIGSNCLIRALLCEIVPVKSFMFRSSPLSSASTSLLLYKELYRCDMQIPAYQNVKVSLVLLMKMFVFLSVFDFTHHDPLYRRPPTKGFGEDLVSKSPHPLIFLLNLKCCAVEN